MITKYINVPKTEISLYDQERGAFCVKGKKKDYVWDSCRDGVQHSYGKLRSFFYNAGTVDNVERAIAFVGRIEQKLHLLKKARVRFRYTDDPGIVYVSLPDWWRSSLRRSILTGLLRISGNYNIKKNNWRQVLRNGYYFKNTRVAIDRFLRGYTKLNFISWHPTSYDAFNVDSQESFYGWVDYFFGMPQHIVKKALVKGKTK